MLRPIAAVDSTKSYLEHPPATGPGCSKSQSYEPASGSDTLIRNSTAIDSRAAKPACQLGQISELATRMVANTARQASKAMAVHCAAAGETFRYRGSCFFSFFFDRPSSG